MLTNAAVKAARPRPRAYKVGDGQGLYLFVAPTGTKSWRLKARLAGRELLLTFGQWPEVSLDAARARRDAARAQLARGEDPRQAPAELTFESVARRWHARRAPEWTAIHARDVLVSLARDVFPAIGAKPIDAIGAPDVLELLEAIAARGAAATARRVAQRVSGVFRYAVARQLAPADPAAAVAGELAAAAPVRRQPALTDLGEARALLAACVGVDAGEVVQLASRFLALTAVRLAALRGARWGEVEDLDGPAPTWRVPAARMKLAAAKKGDAAHDHLVPLSRQAVDVLRAAQEYSRNVPGPRELIFPGRGGRAALGEATIGDLYARAGYAGRHVPHGWRATFSTVLNERHPESRGLIDRALGHVDGRADKVEDGINRRVEGAYNRSVQLDPRRRLFQQWADLLMPPGTSPAAAG